MTVTVYMKPACGACVATKNTLKNKGITFEVKNLMEEPEALDRFIGMGLQAAPIVEAGEEVWSGFREDRINALAEKLAV